MSNDTIRSFDRWYSGLGVTYSPEQIEYMKFGYQAASTRNDAPVNEAAKVGQGDDSPELLALIERVKWLIDDGVRYQGSFSDMATHSKAQADRARLADYLNGIRLDKQESNTPKPQTSREDELVKHIEELEQEIIELHSK